MGFDEKYMRRALGMAKRAGGLGEVPVGAVIVHDNRVIAAARNMREGKNDPCAHAEIVALRRAGTALGRWNLSGCDMYVTLEPCCMCAGALVNARISNVYFGAYDHRFGACGSLYSIADEGRLNHTVNVVGGIMESECAEILTNFFRKRR